MTAGGDRVAKTVGAKSAAHISKATPKRRSSGFDFKESAIYAPPRRRSTEPAPPVAPAKRVAKPAPRPTRAVATAPAPATPAPGPAPAAVPAPQPQKPVIAALRKPKAFVPPSAKRKPLRPTLSDQLASIGALAETLTNEINKKHGVDGKEPPLYATPSRNFVVGRVTSKFPSPVQFFRGYCTYVFHHPFKKSQITMEMHYGDMTDVQLSDARRTLSFRIPHALDQFGDDYDYRNRQHAVVIEFNSEKDCRTIRTQFVPVMKGVATMPPMARSGSGGGSGRVGAGATVGSSRRTVSAGAGAGSGGT